MVLIPQVENPHLYPHLFPCPGSNFGAENLGKSWQRIPEFAGDGIEKQTGSRKLGGFAWFLRRNLNLSSEFLDLWVKMRVENQGLTERSLSEAENGWRATGLGCTG